MSMELETPKATSSGIHKARALLETGEFEQALAMAQDAVGPRSGDLRWDKVKAQALTALGRPQEALEALRDAHQRHPDDITLLRLARSIAFQHGYWSEALTFGEQVLKFAPDDVKLRSIQFLTLLAMGRGEEVKRYVSTTADIDLKLIKPANFYDEIEVLRHNSPSIIDAWEAALGIKNAPITNTPEEHSDPVTVVQYWSQGELPTDIAIVFSKWEKLAIQLGLGPVVLFNKDSASAWISQHAPEFSRAFASAFHYAMESDIFRIAYASKKPCLYVDTDGWPLPQAADILQAAMRQGTTMLCFRAYRPWVINGFFLSYPTCSFVRLLVDQTASLNFEEMPQNHATIDATFGPSRYNEVFRSLVQTASSKAVFQPEGVAGLSILRLGNSDLSLTHEAAVASVKPPFALAYKTTEANWKRHGARE